MSVTAQEMVPELSAQLKTPPMRPDANASLMEIAAPYLCSIKSVVWGKHRYRSRIAGKETYVPPTTGKTPTSMINTCPPYTI